MPNPIINRRNVGNQIKAALRRDASGIWLFENGANLGLDSSSWGNHLTNNNSVSQVAGRVGQAASFASASSQYLSIADNASLSLDTATAFTVACWFYLADNSVQRILMQKDVAGGNREFTLRHLTATSRLSFAVGNGVTTSISVDATSFGAPALTTWHHVVAWFDGAFVYIQVNGGAINSTAYTGAMLATAAVFGIGANNTPAAFWDGRLDAAGLWKRVLTAQERAWLAAGGSLA